MASDIEEAIRRRLEAVRAGHLTFAEWTATVSMLIDDVEFLLDLLGHVSGDLPTPRPLQATPPPSRVPNAPTEYGSCPGAPVPVDLQRWGRERVRMAKPTPPPLPPPDVWPPDKG